MVRELKTGLGPEGFLKAKVISATGFYQRNTSMVDVKGSADYLD